MPNLFRHPYTAVLFLIAVLVVACQGGPALPVNSSLSLAGFTDSGNDVAVTIRLKRTTGTDFELVATFTPPTGYHLYSKDIPRGGVRGQGRPTLIELAAGSQMQAAGPLA